MVQRAAEAKWRQLHADKMNALRAFLLDQMRHVLEEAGGWLEDSASALSAASALSREEEARRGEEVEPGGKNGEAGAAALAASV